MDKAVSSEPRGYKDAIAQLNSLQSNAETIRKSAECRRDPAQHIPQMRDYLTRVGLSMAEIDRLSVIHVAGTKGKGCTCAFVESILRRCPEVGKVGFYSSPHLLGVCERIRINGQPIHEDMFSKYFWDVYDKLKRTQDDYCGDMPFYFSFLTVMSLYVFVREAVNVAILEVGIGGEYDSTNVVQRPVVCGVTSLDLDHTNLLGNTLDKIAWQKAGIFKSCVPAITVRQSTNSAMDVILKRAKEKGCPLYVAQPLASTGLPGGLPLGIAGDRQRYNAALAVQLCQVWLQTRADNFECNTADSDDQTSVTCVSDLPILQTCLQDLPKHFIEGLSSCRWHGRYQTICRPGVTYYLDGAHTPDSIEACEQWFQKAAERESGQRSHNSRGGVCRSLVFNVTGGRDASTLLDKLKDCGFQRAAFCPNTWQDPTGRQDGEAAKIDETVLRNRAAWENLQSVCTPNDVTARQHKGDAAPENPCVSQAFPCVMSALAWAAWDQDEKISAVMVGNGNTDTGQHVQVLVTGSLYLVGAVLGGLAE